MSSELEQKNKELKEIQAAFLIERTGATDAEGNRFEFGKTYFFFDGSEIKRFVSRYSCNALIYTQINFDGVLIYQHIKNNFQDVEFKIPLSGIFTTVNNVVPSAISQLELRKIQLLESLRAKLDSNLKEYTDAIDVYNEVIEKIQLSNG